MQNQYGNMRVLASSRDSGLGDIQQLALQHGYSNTDVTAMRALGFARMDAMIDAELAGMGFRAAAPTLMPTRSEVVMDNLVIQVGTNRLQFVAEMIREGLVTPFPGALGVPFLETWMESNETGAERTMDPETRTEDSQALMLASLVPIYITKNSFSYGVRQLAQARRIGMPIDTRSAEQKVRSINEAIEDAAVNGPTTRDGQALVVNGNSSYGLLTAPNANTQVLTAAAWTTAPVGTTVMSEINSMKTKLINDFKRGPYTLFVPPAVDQALDLDFKANGNDSIRVRISQMSAGGRPLRIVLLDTLPATKVVLAQMTKDVMDLIDGIRPTIIPYTSATGLTFRNIVMAIMVPRFRTDYSGNSGIVIGTFT